MFNQALPKAHIVASSSSFPGQYYAQTTLADTICDFLTSNDLDFPIESVRSLFKNVEIDGRHFRFPVEDFCNGGKMGKSIEDAIETCVQQSEINVRNLLEASGLKGTDIAQIVSVTLTPTVPSMCARLMNRVAFAPHTKRMPLAGLGCMAGVAGISRAADYLASHPTEALILISCELSSGLWQGSVQTDLLNQIRSLKSDTSQYHEVVMSIVTAALFGDGSGALLMVGDEHPLAKTAAISVFANRSNWIPDTEHIMGLDVLNDGMRNILRPEVKTFVGAGLKSVIEPLLKQFKLSSEDIDEWTLHPGGPKIMDAAESAFNLPKEKMQGSRDTLRKVGNISSATILYMLDQTLKNKRPQAGSKGMIVAMGPGFSQEAVLVGWN
ncbi:MAG: hypothetical protein K2P84_09200 [Undibacterium sp.]|nr:hypothetical protein [Undibacterium sp.]